MIRQPLRYLRFSPESMSRAAKRAEPTPLDELSNDRQEPAASGFTKHNVEVAIPHDAIARFLPWKAEDDFLNLIGRDLMRLPKMLLARVIPGYVLDRLHGSGSVRNTL
jgi:hypothetical protein